ncbi:MAG TPA: cell division protein FtsZ [Bacteroidales bacterium]|nr:cell division protein FtsZ [Bacteroidales bacterium]
MLKFDLPKNQSSIIKVIGVGGGGSNAVSHMHRLGIKGVDFMICNTDAQAMEASPVPVKIQLGANLTGGLGAGAVPSIGKNAALENIQDIRAMLEKGTKMLFVTAGLGGGTGTGAAPVIASVSKELGILTVGIVTLPFSFEGRKRKQHAEQGIAELKKYVDALLIICNDKLRELFGDQRLSAAFAHADDVLATAAKGIAEIITVTGYINVDFEDVKTVMRDSGVAILGTGVANGENRARKAVEMAISSPLLNDNNIEGANNLLLYIASGKDEITMDEVTEITDYIQEKTKNSAEVIWGNGIDETLEDRISVTIIATGFDEEHRKKPSKQGKPHTIKQLYDEDLPVTIKEPAPPPVVTEPIVIVQNDPVEIHLVEKKPESPVTEKTPEPEQKEPQRIITFDFQRETPRPEPAKPQLQKPEPAERQLEIPVSETLPQDSVRPAFRDPAPREPEEMDRNLSNRVQKLKALSEKLKNHTPIEANLQEIESVPAYKRRNVELTELQHSSESQAARYTLSEGSDKTIEIRSENAFLHKNVD